MSRPELPDIRGLLRRESEEARTAVRGVVSDVRSTWGEARTFAEKLNTAPVITPVSLRRFLLTAIKVLIGLEILAAIVQGLATGIWSRLGGDLFVAGILYILWDRITRLAQQKKDAYRRRMEASGERPRIWDALVFSLLWTDEIYTDIPADRRHLVVTAYVLIALGLVAGYVGFGEGFMSLIVSGALVLAAVNLLSWVVSRERGERNTLQTELQLARDVQLSLMPSQAPSLDGFDIAGVSLPASEVGGDHFDYVPLDGGDRLLAVTLCDVSGKGMQAAMSAVFTSGAFVSEARRSLSPAEMLTRLNASIVRYSPRGHFVTFLCTVLDRDARTLTFANAGQTKPLHVRDGAATWLDAQGVTFALGMTANASYEDRTITLASGDMFLFLSDGVTEAMNPAHEPYGSERIAAFLQSARDGSAESIVGSVVEEVQRWSAGAPQHDDVTIVAVKVR